MNSFDTDLAIDTPENVYFNYRVAGIGSRFLAALIDTFFIALLELAIGFLLIWPLSNIFDRALENVSDWILAFLAMFIFGIFWSYYIFFESVWNGQTPGKRRVGLRVIRTDGMPIRFTDSVIRNLVRTIDFLPVNYALGVITMFISDESRRLGDLAAGTLVVYDLPKAGIPELNNRQEPKQGPISRKLLSDWPTHLLSQNDLQMVEDYFQRRDQLTNRHELAEHILRRLLQKMDLPDQLALQEAPEDRLEEIMRAVKLKAN